MADSIGSVQGLATGIQWRDMVDQLSAIDQARELDPVTKAISKSQKQSDAWTSYSTIAAKLGTALAGLRDGTAFDSFQVATDSSATTNRALLYASATSGAVPASYQVEVLDTARSDKLSGTAFGSATAALGIAAGDFVINGAKVSVTAADSLNAIRDKINALNSGTNASGVSASVLGSATGTSRLVLSSDTTGARGIQLVDSASTGGVLEQLGVTDGTYTGGTREDGSTGSGRFSSAELAIGQLFGLVSPPATSIQVGNRTISIDLAVDTLATIAAKVMAAGIAARVTTTTAADGTSQSQLDIDSAVSAMPSAGNPAVPDPDGQRVLQMLGVLQAGRSAVPQALGSTALTDAANAPVTAATLLSDVQANGGSANFQVGDTVLLSGRRGDGTATSSSFTITGSSTVGDLLAQMNGATGFGGGTRNAVASLGADGRIHLGDATAGNSQLTVALSVNKSVSNGGGTTGIGAFALETSGRVREVSQGSDARFRLDGVLLSRPTNAVSDAITGLTLNLQQAEAETTVGVTVSRNSSGALNSVNEFVSAYNALNAFVKANTATGAALANSTALKASARAFTNTLLSDVAGSVLTRTALVGVALDKNGLLAVDVDAFTKSMKTNAAAVKALFSQSGTTTGTGLEFVDAGNNAVAGTYAVDITTAATRAAVTGSAATFPFAAGGTPAHLTFTDSASGVTDSIVLANGDDASAVAVKLNAVFSARHMLMSATSAGGQLSIGSTQYGSSGGFTLDYDVGDATSANQLGVAAGSYAGLNVAGTINGVAATGAGQTLTAAAGNAADGVVLRYSGNLTGAIGSTTLVVGVAAQMARQVSSITRAGDGVVQQSVDALTRSRTSATARSSDIAARLERRKQSLLKQFAAMEAAISRINAQGNSITSSLNALSALQSNK